MHPIPISWPNVIMTQAHGMGGGSTEGYLQKKIHLENSAPPGAPREKSCSVLSGGQKVLPTKDNLLIMDTLPI